MSRRPNNALEDSRAVDCELIFFSRGRGRGHAIPDMEIASEIAKLCPLIKITFCSYATGAAAFREGGWPVIDMNLPDDVAYTDVLVAASRIVRERRRSILVSHEEFGALAAGRVFEMPTIYIADWLPNLGTISAEAVATADACIVMENPGIFQALRMGHGSIVYTGPMVRKMRYETDKRGQARRELDLPEDAFVVTVMPGGWATEARLPIAAKVFGAAAALSLDRLKILWMTSVDKELVRSYAEGSELNVISRCDCVERVMVASDLIVTKGNRGTLMEAASLGIPSISLSPRTNLIDDLLVGRIQSNVALNAAAVDVNLLRHLMEPAEVERRRIGCQPLSLHTRGAEIAAEFLADEVRKLLVQYGGSDASTMR